jgi:hypothetical protein
MFSRQMLVWLHTRNWCEIHPRQKAAIFTPMGMFEVIFYPDSKDSDADKLIFEFHELEKK